jgi:hypothetical protein
MEGMMDMKPEDLTAGERLYLEHTRAAKGHGVTLAQYYRANGLSVYTLYNIRRGLIRKVWSRGTGDAEQERWVRRGACRRRKCGNGRSEVPAALEP